MFAYIIQAILIMVHKNYFSNNAVLYLLIKLFISNDKILLQRKEFTLLDTF